MKNSIILVNLVNLVGVIYSIITIATSQTTSELVLGVSLLGLNVMMFNNLNRG